jgi:hypothetical protein
VGAVIANLPQGVGRTTPICSRSRRWASSQRSAFVQHIFWISGKLGKLIAKMQDIFSFFGFSNKYAAFLHYIFLLLRFWSK